MPVVPISTCRNPAETVGSLGSHRQARGNGASARASAVHHLGRPARARHRKRLVSGHRAGDAIADVLFGRVNPSGKLSATFPQNVGQIPLYYNHKNTGRPLPEGEWFQKFRSNYLDVSNEPLYPFGYGLSYTTFNYGELQLSKTKLQGDEALTATIKVTNSGEYDEAEVVQLYVRNVVGSITRPVKELKGFRKISINREKRGPSASTSRPKT